MAAIDINYIMPKVMTLLPFVDNYIDSAIYDEKVKILIPGAISKLRGEGVDIEAKDKEGNYFFVEDRDITQDYIICLTYQVLKDMDFDTDYNFMTEQYITRVNTLRCYITAK